MWNPEIRIIKISLDVISLDVKLAQLSYLTMRYLVSKTTKFIIVWMIKYLQKYEIRQLFFKNSRFLSRHVLIKILNIHINKISNFL